MYVYSHTIPALAVLLLLVRVVIFRIFLLVQTECYFPPFEVAYSTSTRGDNSLSTRHYDFGSSAQVLGTVGGSLGPDNRLARVAHKYSTSYVAQPHVPEPTITVYGCMIVLPVVMYCRCCIQWQ